MNNRLHYKELSNFNNQIMKNLKYKEFQKVVKTLYNKDLDHNDTYLFKSALMKFGSNSPDNLKMYNSLSFTQTLNVFSTNAVLSSTIINIGDYTINELIAFTENKIENNWVVLKRAFLDLETLLLVLYVSRRKFINELIDYTDILEDRPNLLSSKVDTNTWCNFTKFMHLIALSYEYK